MAMELRITALPTRPTPTPRPEADFSANVTRGCEPLTVNFTDSSTNATSWSWSFPGGSPSSASTQGPHTVTYSNPGSYNVSLNVSNACGWDEKAETNYITVDPKPEADFSAKVWSLQICPQEGRQAGAGVFLEAFLRVPQAQDLIL